MAFDAGSMIAHLGLDISNYTRGMFQVQSLNALFPAQITNFLANPLLGLAGIMRDALSGITSAISEIGKAADDAGESAERIGVSVQFLTGVGAVAKDAGASMQSLGDALKFLNNNAADAATGRATARAAFAGLGISATDAMGKIKPTEALFFEVADAMAKLPNAALKTQAAMNLLGRGGTDLIPTLNKGSAGIKEFASIIERLGGTVDSSLAASGDKFGTLSTIIDAAMTGIKRAVAEPFLQLFGDNMDEIVPKIEAFSGMIRAGIGEAFKFMKPIVMEAIPAFMSVGEVVVEVLGGAFSAIGPILKGFYPLIKGLADLVKGVLVPAMKLVKPVLDAIGTALGFVAKVMAEVASWIGKLLSGFSSLSGITMPSVAFGGGGGGGGGGGNFDSFRTPTGEGGVKIDTVNIQSPPLPEAATTRIAAELRSPLQQAIQRQHSEFESSMKAAAARGNL